MLDRPPGDGYASPVLRLTKKTEYALLALRSLASEAGASEARNSPGPADLVTARAIAQRYQIPEMLLAKVLQRLKRSGIVVATKGSGGGYRLARPLSQVPLIAVLSLFDEHTNLVECQDDHGNCQQLESCDIKGPLAVLNAALMEPLRHMTVEDLFVTPRPLPRPEPSRFRIIASAR
jgi:Rrf2 family protein